MSIMDLFRTAVTTSAPAQGTPNGQPGAPATMNGQPPAGATTGAGNPGNIPATAATTGATTAGTAPNGTIPDSNAKTAAESPLDKFTDLWKNDPNGTGKNTPYFNPNMDALNAAAGQIDFSSAITADHYKAIAAGGEGSIKAFAESMNSVARNVFAQSALATTKIVEAGLAKAETRINSGMPDVIRRHSLSDGLRTDNPALSHPAAQPLIAAIESTLVQKYPNATPTELRAMAGDYLTAFATSVAPAKADTTTANSGGSKEVDWSTFLGS